MKLWAKQAQYAQIWPKISRKHEWLQNLEKSPVPGKALPARVAHVVLPALVNLSNVSTHLVAGGEKFATKLEQKRPPDGIGSGFQLRQGSTVS